ncbi:Tn3 family transposase [Paraburkholderia piptadeniae]|uniref:Tn3 family transposase n=1 Tax=Paraburkholderia piptadeniae TaxID=1701573 RepID=UPI0022A83A26|nr:Tn3 family transposase [Paraburkholderia piptadeniae]
MMNRIADERKLRQATDAAAEIHALASDRGTLRRADLASSDMMSLETARTVWQAWVDPRRRTRSIGMHTHVRDRWGIFYDQPIILNELKAGAAIEGVIRQSSADAVASSPSIPMDTDYTMGSHASWVLTCARDSRIFATGVCTSRSTMPSLRN